MLQKRDLVKQFELVVKQEIVNHNNAILATNLAINNIQKKCNELSQKIEDVKKYIDGLISNQKIEYVKEKSNLAQIINVLKKSFGKYKEDNTKEILAFFEKTKKMIDGYVLLEDLNNYKSLIFKGLCLIRDDISCIKSKSSHDKKELDNSINNVIDLVEDISNNQIPEEINFLDCKYENKMGLNNNEKEALLREIAILKKTCFINEKKIENLYTLIERMKKS